MNFVRTALLAIACLLPSFASAQWQVPDHSVPVGRGGGAQGFKNALPGPAGQALTSNGPNADPTFQLPSVKPGVNIAGLKALTAPANGGVQYVSGFLTPGDGGQGEFVFNAASAVADNGGTIIAPNAGAGRWLRIYSGAVNPDWFGAGDVNVVANSSTAFTGAIGVASDQVQTTPGKTYVVSGLALPNSVSLNLSGSSLRLPAGSAERVLTITGTGQTLDCAGGSIIMPAGATPDVLVFVNKATSPTVQNCSFPNSHMFGIRNEGTVNVTIQGNSFGPSDQAFGVVWFSNNLTGAYTGSITSTTLNITGVTYGGLAVGDTIYGAGIPEDTTITAFNTGGGGVGSYTISRSLTVASENINGGPRVLRGSNVSNNYFADGAIQMSSDGGTITNNYFYNRAANGAATNTGSFIMAFNNSGVPGSYVANSITVTGNVIDGVPLGPLNDANCAEIEGSNHTITGNTCRNSQRQGFFLHSNRGTTFTGNTCENVGLAGGGFGICVALAATMGDFSGGTVTGNVARDTAASPTSVNFCQIAKQNYASSFTGSIAGNTLTIPGSITGNLTKGALVSGAGVAAGTIALGQINIGVWWVSIAQNVASTAMTTTSPFTVHDVSVQGNTAENISGEFCPLLASGGGTVLGSNVVVAGNQGGTAPDTIGNFYAPNIVSTADVGVPAVNSFYWTGGSVMRSSADGVITLYNSAQNNFGLLQLGGPTSGFPGLKRSGVGLQARLADDTGFTTFQASTFTGVLNGNATTATTAGAVPVGGITGLGTGVATALGVNVGTAGAPVVNGGALGTPSGGVLTNATGLPIGTGVGGLAAGIASWLAAPSSANLRGAVTDETGTGALYFQNGDIGTPSAGVGTNLTGTAAGLTAGNATKLTTPRAIGIGGSCGLTATGVNFDGSAAINPALAGTTTVACGGTGATTAAGVQALVQPGLMYSAPVTVNFNSANTDTAIPITLPAGLTRALGFRINIFNASASLTAANFGVFTTVGGGGGALIAAATAITVSSAADATLNNIQSAGTTLTAFVSSSLPTPSTVYFRVGAATGAAATAQVVFEYFPLP